MSVLPAILAVAMAAPAAASTSVEVPSAEALHATIAELDSAVFDAFNRCSDPAQFERHANFFSEDIEFSHDTGGVTWTRAAMLEKTSKPV